MMFQLLVFSHYLSLVFCQMDGEIHQIPSVIPLFRIIPNPCSTLTKVLDGQSLEIRFLKLHDFTQSGHFATILQIYNQSRSQSIIDLPSPCVFHNLINQPCFGIKASKTRTEKSVSFIYKGFKSLVFDHALLNLSSCISNKGLPARASTCFEESFMYQQPISLSHRCLHRSNKFCCIHFKIPQRTLPMW